MNLQLLLYYYHRRNLGLKKNKSWCLILLKPKNYKFTCSFFSLFGFFSKSLTINSTNRLFLKKSCLEYNLFHFTKKTDITMLVKVV